MEITGRITRDAEVRRAGEKEVLNFTIAVNDRYKAAGSSEYKQVTTFINCSYWISMKAGQWVKKGVVVLLQGRLGMHVYINSDGNPIGSIDFHVNEINIVAFAKRSSYNADELESTVSGKKGNGRTAPKNGNDKAGNEVPF
ncbi:single-stranded DNA-binding protein [Flavobacterium sp. CGRL1]